MRGGDLGDRLVSTSMWSWAWLALAFPGRSRMASSLAGVVAPHPERVEPEPALEVRRRLLLLRVRGDQRGVHIEHDHVTEIGASRPAKPAARPAADAQTCRRTLARASPIRFNAAGVISSNARHTVAGEATGPSRPVLVAQRVDVGDRLPARGEDRGHIDQHPPAVMDRDEPRRANATDTLSVRPDPVGQQTHRRQPRPTAPRRSRPR